MPEHDKKRPSEPDLCPQEVELLGALFSFCNKSLVLLQQSSLDDEKRKIVGDRIKSVVADIRDEIKRTEDLDMSGRLEAAFEEIERLVDELSSGEEGEEA